MNRIAAYIGALVAAAVLCWFFPLFHVVPRAELMAKSQATDFHAAEFARDFWTAQLLPALDQAPDASVVLAALRDNPQQAREKFGRSAGLGRTALYLVRGDGTIVDLDDKSVGISLTGASGAADVALATGLLFGNTVRDSTGLVRGDDFSNSQQFNEVSAELNRLVETTVIPGLKQHVKVGQRIEFVGCAAVTSVPRDITPLTLIPLLVKQP